MTGYAKPDRITNSEDVGSEIGEAIYRALRPVDETAHQMEMKWGVDRLEQLVEPELAAKFGTAKAQLDQAIDEGDPVMVAQKGGAMIRGWMALDAAAAHQLPIDQVATAWHWRHPETDQPYAITKDNASAQVIRKLSPAPIIYTMDEVCRILTCNEMALVNSVKEQFPGSTVKDVRPKQTLDDEIPF